MSLKELYQEELKSRTVEPETTDCQRWFQTQTELSEGILTITAFKKSDWFELEISRSLAFETKRFICVDQDQVWEMLQQIMKDTFLHFKSLNRTGFVRANGERCLFKVGDVIVCQSKGEKSECLQLASPFRGEGYVALIDKKDRLVNEVEVEQLYRSLYGGRKERRLPLRRNISTGEIEWSRVIRLKSAS